MNLPEIHQNNIQDFLNTPEIIEKTILQIKKDFSMFGIEIILKKNNTENVYHELLQQITRVVSDLIKHHYDKLLAVLYRIDLTEKEIAKAEKELPNYTLTEVVAHQIIMRELKKVLIRTYFDKKNTQNS